MVNWRLLPLLVISCMGSSATAATTQMPVTVVVPVASQRYSSCPPAKDNLTCFTTTQVDVNADSLRLPTSACLYRAVLAQTFTWASMIVAPRDSGGLSHGAA